VVLERAIKTDVLKSATPEVLGGLDKVPDGSDKFHAGVSEKKVDNEPWV